MMVSYMKLDNYKGLMMLVTSAPHLARRKARRAPHTRNITNENLRTEVE